jgi:hypothetical protein
MINSQKSAGLFSERKESRPLGLGFFPLVFLMVWLGLFFVTGLRPLWAAPPQISKFGPYYLTQQKLGNGLWHFRISLAEPQAEQPWITTPMLAEPSSWAGPHDGPESRLYLSGLDGSSPQ